jgi:hypothetical protein
VQLSHRDSIRDEKAIANLRNQSIMESSITHENISALSKYNSNSIKHLNNSNNNNG